MISTQRLSIHPTQPEPEAIRLGIQLLAEGEPIVFPTETVYGLGADLASTAGIEKIYRIKNRTKTKPLPVMIGNLEMLSLLVEKIPKEAVLLMKTFWPGPLTLVLPAKPSQSRTAAIPGETVAVRYPNHPVPLALIRGLGNPVVATSANLSGNSSPKTAKDALLQLDGKIRLILDGGNCAEGKESTLVDCTGPRITILRAGAIPPGKIKETIQ